jgi:large subunit ribosomal protein L29
MVKQMKVNEIRDMTTEELESKVTSLKEELFNLRFQSAMNKLDNPNRIVTVKRTIARIKTVIRERELVGEEKEN